MLKVFCYFNLHRKCFSVKALEGPSKGRVIAHRDNVLLHDVTFKVSQAGRARVIREQRKNVHAGVCGTWLDSTDDYTTGIRISIIGSAIMYNPYKYSTFVHLFGEHPATACRIAALNVSNKKPSIHTWN